MRTALRTALTCLAALPIVAWAQPQGSGKRTALDVKASGNKTFHMNSRVGNSQVSIFSESTLEDFTGVCNQVAGKCSVDPKALETFRGRFSIRVKDIATGIELRDTHMHGPDWLDAAKYPEIVMEITAVDDVKTIAGDTASMTLVGTCTLHGKSNSVRIPATVKYLDQTPATMRRVKGDLIRIRSKFGIKLSDYGVSGPAGSDAIGLKVSDDIEIRVTVFGSTEPPPDALEADEGTDSPRRAPPPRKKPE